ncbi:MAG TPA: D-2-hydroxyacid dehydrogenase family protein [Roseomonas sp.]|jgi:D-3-phosphoglycerate dehydrogenase
MKIAVIDDYQDAFRRQPGFAGLAGHEVTVFTDTVKDPAALGDRLADAEAVVLTQQRSALPRAALDRMPALRMISQTGRNAAHIDLAACAERGIIVSAGGGGGPEATAELCWALILASLRHIPEEVGRLRQGLWQHTLGTGLKGRTLGVYAYGRIGSLVARVGQAFGMQVLCWGRAASLGRAQQDGFAVAASREAFFAAADVLTLHIPLNPATRGIVTAADLSGMKPDALLVNTSRAPIIAPGALEAALRAGRPGRAAIDVFDSEPVLGASDPLIGLPNTLCTPHLGYVEEGAYAAIFGVAIEQLLAFAAGKPINLVPSA